ncbi:MAG: cell division protein FtsZ, partial [Bacteroidales bacterium]
LATGFDLSNVPGILEYRTKKSQEELEEEDRQRAEAERKKQENMERIAKVYGSSVSFKLTRRSNPIVLSTEQLDDEEIIRLMENNPTYSRGAEVTNSIKEALSEKENSAGAIDNITITF